MKLLDIGASDLRDQMASSIVNEEEFEVNGIASTTARHLGSLWTEGEQVDCGGGSYFMRYVIRIGDRCYHLDGGTDRTRFYRV